MPLRRLFRGRVVKRTRRLGPNIVVTFRGAAPGQPGPRVAVALREYLAEVRASSYCNTTRNP